MKIAVIGAAGKAGSLIVKEALGRGHAVTAIVRPGSEGRVPAGCALLSSQGDFVWDREGEAAALRAE